MPPSASITDLLASAFRETILHDRVGGSGADEGVVRRRRSVHQQELARLHPQEITAQFPTSRGHPAQDLGPHTGKGVGPVSVPPVTAENKDCAHLTGAAGLCGLGG